jgi:hypothetical protein
MNADPEVRRYIGPLLTFEQAAAWLLNHQDDLDRYGYGPRRGRGPFRRQVLYRKLRNPDN